MPNEKFPVLLSRFAVLAGLGALLISAFAHPIAQWLGTSGQLRFRILLAVIGLLLLGIGLLRHRFVPVYKDAVLLVANVALLLLILEFAAAIAVNLPLLGQVVSGQTQAVSGGAIEKPKMVSQNISVRHARFVGWLGEPQETDGLKIDANGLRATLYAPTDQSSKPIKVFAFGGSTMWGEGVRDDETIPSYLHAALTRQTGYPVRVTNFGQRGWVSTQGLSMLMLQLQRGNVPDVVVFYDGYNDTYAPNTGAQVGYPEDLDGLQVRNAGRIATAARFVQETNLGRLLIDLTGIRPSWPDIDVAGVSRSVADAYLQVYEMVGALAQEYGFSVRFYWQPQLLAGRKPLTPFEQQIYDDHPWNNETVKQLTDATYRIMAKEATSRDDLADISDAFDAIADPVYFDPCHLLPLGNERVANAMITNGLVDSVLKKIEAKRLD